MEKVTIEDLLEEMWGIICNVNNGNLSDERKEWFDAFLRLREKYFKYLNGRRARCPECGKELEITVEAQSRANAVGGKCFDCVSKIPVSHS